MVKVISLSDEAYRTLKALKRNKSFSQTVIELAKHNNGKNILSFAGAFADNKKEWKNIKGVLEEDRKKAKLREVNL